MPAEYRNAIVLVWDGLSASMLGAYGNTCVDTPNFNRLAAESMVFDQAFTGSTELESQYCDLLASDSVDLIESLGESGVGSVLLTDDSEVASFESTQTFERAVQVDPVQSSGLADAFAETEMAAFFAQATDWVNNADRGSIGWLHSRGLFGAWDAPYSTRVQLADSEDPDPPEFHQVPAVILANDFDPDELLGYQQACNAQIALLDRCLGVFLDVLEASGAWSSTMLCLLSPRGFPMGEHLVVGRPSESEDFVCLQNEAIHVPLMLRPPQHESYADAIASRVSKLVQPQSVIPLIQAWLKGNDEASKAIMHQFLSALPDKRSEIVFTRTSNICSAQTHAWKLIRSGEESRLYAKPDDLWEANDVSRRCPGIVEQLESLIERWKQDSSFLNADGFQIPEELAERP